MQFGGDILQRASAQHDLLGGEFDLRRDRQMRNDRCRAPAAPATREPARRHCRLGDEPVGIELARRQRRAQQRRRAEADVAVACQVSARAPRRHSSPRSVRAAPPNRSALTFAAMRHGWIVAACPSGRAERPASSRLRSAARAHRSSARRRDRPTSARWPGIDIEMNAGAVAVGALPRRDPKRIARARQHEIAVAADRAGQRTHVAAEGDIVQFERAAAGRVVQGDAAGEIEPVDRQRAQIDRPGRGRPVDPPLRDRGRDRATCR